MDAEFPLYPTNHRLKYIETIASMYEANRNDRPAPLPAQHRLALMALEALDRLGSASAAAEELS